MKFFADFVLLDKTKLSIFAPALLDGRAFFSGLLSVFRAFFLRGPGLLFCEVHIHIGNNDSVNRERTILIAGCGLCWGISLRFPR